MIWQNISRTGYLFSFSEGSSRGRYVAVKTQKTSKPDPVARTRVMKYSQEITSYLTGHVPKKTSL